MLKCVGLDYDGTLATTEKYYRESEKRLLQALRGRGVSKQICAAIKDDIVNIQKNNMRTMGFGAGLQYRTFIDLVLKHAPDRLDSGLVGEITTIIEDLRAHKLDYYEDVERFVEGVKRMGVPVILITKGEAHHQHEKMQHFSATFGDHLNGAWRHFVVPDKSLEDYAMVLRSCGLHPFEFLMIGDSERSDIVPVRQLGAHAVLIRREDMGEGVKWDFEKAGVDDTTPAVKTLDKALFMVENLVRGRHILFTTQPGTQARAPTRRR